MGKKSRLKRLNRENLIPKNNNHKKQVIAGQVILYTGFGLYFWALILTSDAIISVKQVILTVLAGTFIGSIFFYAVRKRYKLPVYFILFLGLVFGGSIPYFTLAATNHYFKSSSAQTIILPVLKTGNHSKRKSACKTPYAVIVYDEIEKEMKFPCEFEKSISNYKKVEISVSTGFWGIPIIIDKKLIQ